MQPVERGIIILDDIPGQDESDVSIRTKGRRTNRSSSSQLPKGSSGSTRRRASAGPATSLTRASELRGPRQGGHESASNAVDALQAYGRGDFIDADEGGSSRADTLQARDSNADGDGELSRADSQQAHCRGDFDDSSDEESTSASGAVDLRGPRRGSPQGSGGQRQHQLWKDQVTRRHVWGSAHPQELRRHGPPQLLPTRECLQHTSACNYYLTDSGTRDAYSCAAKGTGIRDR
jgi:hypothetical protein